MKQISLHEFSVCRAFDCYMCVFNGSMYDSLFCSYLLAVQNLSLPQATVRLVTHFHYEGWPDNGVPNTTHGLRKLIQLVDDCHPTGPITVHCSAGIGRAGAFCTVHVILQRLKKWLVEVHQGYVLAFPIMTRTVLT